VFLHRPFVMMTKVNVSPNEYLPEFQSCFNQTDARMMNGCVTLTLLLLHYATVCCCVTHE
jgi:hypothetical protein